MFGNHGFLAFITAVSFASSGAVYAQVPDADRGAKLEAAARADDAKALLALLRPEDRTKGNYRLPTDPAGVTHPVSNLLFQTKGPNSAAYQTLVEYGISVEPHLFERGIQNLRLFKEHYPNFLTTLGPRAVNYACNTGNEAMLASFVSEGVKPGPDDLTVAVKRNQAAIVAKLIKLGVPATGTIKVGTTELTPEAYARKAMQFSVLESLGCWNKYQAELESERKGRPGDGATAYLGLWSFPEPPITVELMSDGTAVVGGGRPDEPSDPVHWLMSQEKEGLLIKVTPVLGFDYGGPFFKLIPLVPKSGKLFLVTNSGLVEGNLFRLSDAQSRDAKAAAPAYDGPTGTWQAEAGAEASVQERQMASSMTITIADGGRVTLSGPMKLEGTMRKTTPERLLLVLSNGAPPMSILGKDGWKTLILGPDNEPKNKASL